MQKPIDSKTKRCHFLQKERCVRFSTRFLIIGSVVLSLTGCFRRFGNQPLKPHVITCPVSGLNQKLKQKEIEESVVKKKQPKSKNNIKTPSASLTNTTNRQPTLPQTAQPIALKTTPPTPNPTNQPVSNLAINNAQIPASQKIETISEVKVQPQIMDPPIKVEPQPQPQVQLQTQQTSRQLQPQPQVDPSSLVSKEHQTKDKNMATNLDVGVKTQIEPAGNKLPENQLTSFKLRENPPGSSVENNQSNQRLATNIAPSPENNQNGGRLAGEIGQTKALPPNMDVLADDKSKNTSASAQNAAILSTNEPIPGLNTPPPSDLDSDSTSTLASTSPIADGMENLDDEMRSSDPVLTTNAAVTNDIKSTNS